MTVSQSVCECVRLVGMMVLLVVEGDSYSGYTITVIEGIVIMLIVIVVIWIGMINGIVIMLIMIVGILRMVGHYCLCLESKVVSVSLYITTYKVTPL